MGITFLLVVFCLPLYYFPRFCFVLFRQISLLACPLVIHLLTFSPLTRGFLYIWRACFRVENIIHDSLKRWRSNLRFWRGFFVKILLLLCTFLVFDADCNARHYKVQFAQLFQGGDENKRSLTCMRSYRWREANMGQRGILIKVLNYTSGFTSQTTKFLVTWMINRGDTYIRVSGKLEEIFYFICRRFFVFSIAAACRPRRFLRNLEQKNGYFFCSSRHRCSLKNLTTTNSSFFSLGLKSFIERIFTFD